jgi:hypothetical protein
MMSPETLAIEKAIKERRLQEALNLCNKAIDSADDDAELRALIRLRAQTHARLRRPALGAADLITLIRRGMGEPEDFFSAALYLLRDDNYADALDLVIQGEKENQGDKWFADEFLFLKGYCSLKLGDHASAAAIAAQLPDDIEMLIKPLARPLRKRDLFPGK